MAYDEDAMMNLSEDLYSMHCLLHDVVKFTLVHATLPRELNDRLKEACILCEKCGEIKCDCCCCAELCICQDDTTVDDDFLEDEIQRLK